jgi:hypothetical protein
VAPLQWTRTKASILLGQVVSLTAEADEGSYFSGWSGDLSGSDNPVVFTLQSSMTVTAAFAEINSEPYQHRLRRFQYVQYQQRRVELYRSAR